MMARGQLHWGSNPNGYMVAQDCLKVSARYYGEISYNIPLQIIVDVLESLQVTWGLNPSC